MPIWQFLAAGALRVNHSLAQPVTRWLAEAGQSVRHADVATLTTTLMQRLLAWFGDVDLCVTPTVGQFAPPIGAWRSLPPAEAFAAAAPLGYFTAPFNLTVSRRRAYRSGSPARGCPIGLQIAGHSTGTTPCSRSRVSSKRPCRGVIGARRSSRDTVANTPISCLNQRVVAQAAAIQFRLLY